MAFGISIDLTGDKQLRAALAALPQKTLDKVVPQALTAVSKPIIAAARRNLTSHGLKGSGFLKKSIGKVIRKGGKYRARGNVLLVIGARSPGQGATPGSGKWVFVDAKGKKHVPANYAHLIELGHRIAKGGKLTRKTRSGVRVGVGTSGGRVQAFPFLRPALDSNRSRAVRDFGDRAWKGIKREAAKLAAKTGVPLPGGP